MDAIHIDWTDLEKDIKNIIAKIEQGGKYIIVKDGKPFAEIKPLPQKSKKLRPFGLCKGEFTVPEDFDAPLPDDILAGFEGKSQ